MAMHSQEEGAVSLRQFRIGMAGAACAASLLVVGVQLITPFAFRADHVKRIAELESRQLGLYQALAGKDQLFQNERRNYVERIKKRDELLHQREQIITLLRSRIGAEAERVERTVSSASLLPAAASEPVGFTAGASTPQLPGSISGR